MKKVVKEAVKGVGHIRIIKETPEKWVKLDVEMDDSTINALLSYADENMSEEERKDLFLNWAFLNVIRKQLKKEGKQCKKR